MIFRLSDPDSLCLADVCMDFWGPSNPGVRPSPEWTPDGASIVVAEHLGYDMYAIPTDGSNLRLIHGGKDFREERFIAPRISPDGSRMAYITSEYDTDGTHNWEIATSALDGSDKRRLTNDIASDTNPIWSPDGMWIAFMSTRDMGSDHDWGMYLMRRDGSDVLRLSPSVRSYYGVSPVWSPDGRRLAFWASEFVRLPDWNWDDTPSMHQGDGDVVVVSSDGTNLRRVGRAMGLPAWSPDGQSLAYPRLDPSTETPEDYTVTIVVASANSAEKREIFSAPFSWNEVRPNTYAYLSDISWSPDGSEIRFVGLRYFSHGRDSDGYLYIGQRITMHSVGQDGTNLRDLAEIYPGGHTAWAPDDSRIAVLVDHRIDPSSNQGDGAVYTIARDGSDKRVLISRPNGGW